MANGAEKGWVNAETPMPGMAAVNRNTKPMRTDFPNVNGMGARPPINQRDQIGTGRIGETEPGGTVATGAFGGSREMEAKARPQGAKRAQNSARERGRRGT